MGKLEYLRVAVAAACLIYASAGRAQSPDIGGDYKLTVDAMTAQGVACSFDGTAVLAQVGTSLTGSAELEETTGNPSCPPMPSASATGEILGPEVSLDWTGPDGVGSSTGTLSTDDLVLEGPVVVTAGPFTSMSGTYVAERVLPPVAGDWRWTAVLDPAGGGAGAPCTYEGQGLLTRDVNALGGSASLELVTGDPGACPAMPTGTASGTIDPAGKALFQVTGPDGTSDLDGVASPDGTSMSGTFSVSSGPFLGGSGTFDGQQVLGSVPTLASIATAVLLGLLVVSGALLAMRRAARPA